MQSNSAPSDCLKAGSSPRAIWDKEKYGAWTYHRRRRRFRFIGLGATYLILILCLQLHQWLVKPTDQSTDDPGNAKVKRTAEASRTIQDKGLRLDEFRPHSTALNVMRGDPTSGIRLRRSARKPNKKANDSYPLTLREFPPNIFDLKVTKKGGWVLNLFIAIYLFGCIAQVCDDYFVPSLEHFCEDFGLTPDVAGATFMAAGSSAPELCTSLIGLFVAKSDVGIGAITGSSLFNILVIVGMVGLLAGMELHITWYPVTRDIFFYIASVAIMVGALADGKVYLWESSLMIIMYSVYIFLMIINRRIRKAIQRIKWTRDTSVAALQRTSTVIAINLEARGRSRIAANYAVDPMELKSVGDDLKSLENIDRNTKDMTVDLIRRASSARLAHAKEEAVELSVNEQTLVKPITTQLPTAKYPITSESLSKEERHIIFDSSADAVQSSSPDTKGPVEEEDKAARDPDEANDECVHVDEYESPLEMPQGLCAQLFFISYFPFKVLHAFTIPDSRILGGWQARLYVVSFMLAVAYISIYSYIMVWMALYAGYGVGIPDSVVGLTVLAAGTSVPDLMSSIYTARDGYGDMAVSNAIGSNIFDILIGLGVPWFVSSALKDNEATEIVNYTIFYTVIFLFVTAAVVWGGLFMRHWNLNKTAGLFYLLLYFITLIFCILIEMNILFTTKK